MRHLAILLAVACTVLPAAAQDPGGAAPTSLVYESDRYQVRATGPQGWSKTLEGPKPAGSWVELVQFSEERTKATVLLSVAATQYRSADEMIDDLVRRFEKDASLAILRKETRGATDKRPKGVFFEYTAQGRGGPVHSFAAYFLYLGNRYRVLGSVREAAWRTVGADMERFASSVEFTGRRFATQVQNFTDEVQNFSIYFPETWTVSLPATGPRVVFTSPPKLGVAVWIYVAKAEGSLSENVDRTVRAAEEGKAMITKRGRERTHPALGVDTLDFEYSRSSGERKYLYKETAMIHGERYYRVVLVGSGLALKAGQEHYDRMIETINFLR